MSRFLPYAAAVLIGIAILATASWPSESFLSASADRYGDCKSSAQPRLASSGPRLTTGSIF